MVKYVIFNSDKNKLASLKVFPTFDEADIEAKKISDPGEEYDIIPLYLDDLEAEVA